MIRKAWLRRLEVLERAAKARISQQKHPLGGLKRLLKEATCEELRQLRECYQTMRDCSANTGEYSQARQDAEILFTALKARREAPVEQGQECALAPQLS